MAELRVALVGCGLISESHLRGYAANRDRARVTVCYDRDTNKAEERADSIGAEVAPSYEAILASADVDAIELCTPPHLHTEQVISALQAGKHASCQKPLARTLEECERMEEVQRETGKVLFYAEMMRTMTSAIRAKEIVASGGIGQLVGIQATYAHWQGGAYLGTPWRYDPKVAGGGELLDGGIHHLDLMLSIGGEVESATCFTNRVRPELGGEDTAVLTLRYKGGHLGSMMSTQAAGTWFPSSSFIAFGTEAILTLGGPFGALTIHRDGGREVLIQDRTDPFVDMVRHYLDVVLTGATSLSTTKEAMEDLRVVLACYRSAETGSAVEVSS